METNYNLLPGFVICITLLAIAYYIIEWFYTQVKVSEFLEHLKQDSKYHVEKYENNKQGYYLTTLKLDNHVFKIGSKNKYKLRCKLDKIELNYFKLKRKRNHFTQALRKKLRFNLR
ncbi:hypothetical protein LX95_01282 [Mesonia algae]|uniref:Uncharacterized protein n=1 Tax=Mesonia algae TaxID=213248 RepID=A0A2W7I3Y8_9FLAO|nr:hypothetical protein [Mesonia algae]PZW41601.1 hypothetical protein LX95_01282 [Mesonia algae]